MFIFKKIAGVVTAVAVTSVLTVGSAFATTDVSEITGLSTDIAAIGTAVMGVLVAICGY
jgi:hypothetical protein